MKFKVGDRVLVKAKLSGCSNKCNGKIRTIKEIQFKTNGKHRAYELNCCDGGIWPDEISLYTETPKTEIEFLDCFQRNFRED